MLDWGTDPNARDSGSRPISMGDLLRQVLHLPGAEISDGPHAAPALFWAAMLGNTAITKSLLDRGADIHTKEGDGRTAFSEAVCRGHVEVVKDMLDAGADPNDRNSGYSNWTPLMLAAMFGKTETAQMLLDRKPDVNADMCRGKGYTVLLLAVSHEYKDTVQMLLDRGAKIKLNTRLSPLYSALRLLLTRSSTPAAIQASLREELE